MNRSECTLLLQGLKDTWVKIKLGMDCSEPGIEGWARVYGYHTISINN